MCLVIKSSELVGSGHKGFITQCFDSLCILSAPAVVQHIRSGNKGI